MTNYSNSGILTSPEGSAGETLRTSTQTTVATAFLIVTMTVAFIGNLAIITVICTHKSMRKDTSNMLIINLSITDLSSTIFVMMSALVSLVSDEWSFGPVWCDFVCAINYCLFIVSALTLCCISIDRYQFILHPLTYTSRVTRRRLFLVIIYTWIQGSAFGMAPSLLKWVSFDYWEAICAIQWQLNRPPSLIYVIVAFLLCFLFPGMILVYCYVNIVKTAKKYRERLRTTAAYNLEEKGGEKGTSMSEQTRIVWSLIIVVIAFFTCTAPFSITKLIKVSAKDSNIVPGPVNLAAALLGYVACAINPLIYGIFRKDVRRAYKELLFQTVLRRKKQPSNDTTT